MAAIPLSFVNPPLHQFHPFSPQPAAVTGGNRYQILNVINKGSYGVVYRALDKKSGQEVAIKHEFEGLSQSTMREISILKSLPPHPSIVEFKKVVVDGRRRVLVVMEYAHTDLKKLMEEKRRPLTLTGLKSMMKQILEGVQFLHENQIMHRDLKPSNILVNSKAQLKICDFGLSRHLESASGSYTPGVVTQWYRAPELLLGATNYTSAIDMWSVGCIMGELVLREVLLPGNSEIDQIICIHQTLGLDDSANLLRVRLCTVATFGGGPLLSASGFDLLLRLLEMDPEKRITAKDALNHSWFTEELL